MDCSPDCPRMSPTLSRSHNPWREVPILSFMTAPKPSPGLDESALAEYLINTAVWLLYLLLEGLPESTTRQRILQVRAECAELADEVAKAAKRAREYAEWRSWDAANAWYETVASAKRLASAKGEEVGQIVRLEESPPQRLVEAKDVLESITDLLERASEDAWAAVEQAENAKVRGREF